MVGSGGGGWGSWPVVVVAAEHSWFRSIGAAVVPPWFRGSRDASIVQEQPWYPRGSWLLTLAPEPGPWTLPP